jgi:hypothetical protein
MKFKLLLFLLLLLVLCGAAWPIRFAFAVFDLLDFYATPRTTSIMLSWETATEFDNARYYIQRGVEIAGPFTTITPLITSVGDPYTGHYYQYEDTSVQIGIQYYYVLQILNADGTSDFTAPVEAIIQSPTTTPTSTPTHTPTPVLSPSTAATITPTAQVPATQTAIAVMPANTVTLTLAPTATNTRTPTTTLEPISIAGIIFPAQTPSPSEISESVAVANPTTEMNEVRGTPVSPSGGRVQSILIVAILLWVALAVFLFFVIRYISRNVTQSS